jgi:hypothetical protein
MLGYMAGRTSLCFKPDHLVRSTGMAQREQDQSCKLLHATLMMLCVASMSCMMLARSSQPAVPPTTTTVWHGKLHISPPLASHILQQRSNVWRIWPMREHSATELFCKHVSLSLPTQFLAHFWITCLRTIKFYDRQLYFCYSPTYLTWYMLIPILQSGWNCSGDWWSADCSRLHGHCWCSRS